MLSSRSAELLLSSAKAKMSLKAQSQGHRSAAGALGVGHSTELEAQEGRMVHTYLLTT